MRKSKFSESQIVAVLKEGEAGMPIMELCRKHGISAPTYYAWKSKCGVAAGRVMGGGGGEWSGLNCIEKALPLQACLGPCASR